MEKNVLAAELTGDDPPTATENLEFLFTLNVDANFEALHCLECVVYVPNWVVATNDNDDVTPRLLASRESFWVAVPFAEGVLRY
jgi:hypothetical protein